MIELECPQDYVIAIDASVPLPISEDGPQGVNVAGLSVIPLMPTLRLRGPFGTVETFGYELVLCALLGNHV